MNTAKIKKLSEQCYALEAFVERCTWATAILTVGGDCTLDEDTSALINSGVQAAVYKEIEALEVKIKTEATK